MAFVIEQRDEQLAGSTANITYEVSFNRAPQHLVEVLMRVSAINTDQLTLSMPVWSPGSYKVRDYIGYQGNVKVFVTSSGRRTEVSPTWRSKTSLDISCKGAESVEIQYVIYGLERTVRTNHINRFHAFIVPTATFMYVEGRTDEIHHVLLKHDRSLWPNVSTQLAPVQAPSQEGVLLGALNYDLLADSPLEIGDHIVKSFEVQGAKHELALASTMELDADWLVEQLKTIVATEAQMFGGLPYDRYTFILQAYDGAGGGLEHLRSSVNACDPSALLDKKKAIKVLSLLCHEFFHVWNVKRIRPLQLGPFNYTQENYTSMLWLSEGFTSYYDDLLTYRCGFITEAEYLQMLSDDHLTRLRNTPGREQVSVRDSSFLAWVKLYMQSPDGVNRFPSYYLKGGVITLLLDLYIIDHSDAKANLDDGMRALWKRYQDDPENGMTEEECIAIIERATGVQLRERLMSWLDGTVELPYTEVMEPVGLRYEVAEKDADTKRPTIGDKRPFANVPAKVSCGWTLSKTGDALTVRSVLDGGPAQLAGIGIDDEILAINGMRVGSAEHADQLMAQAGQAAVTVTAHCDGRLYETQLTAEPVMNVVLSKIQSPTERQKANLAKWLNR